MCPRRGHGSRPPTGKYSINKQKKPKQNKWIRSSSSLTECCISLLQPPHRFFFRISGRRCCCCCCCCCCLLVVGCWLVPWWWLFFVICFSIGTNLLPFPCCCRPAAAAVRQRAAQAAPAQHEPRVLVRLARPIARTRQGDAPFPFDSVLLASRFYLLTSFGLYLVFKSETEFSRPLKSLYFLF